MWNWTPSGSIIKQVFIEFYGAYKKRFSIGIKNLKYSQISFGMFKSFATVMLKRNLIFHNVPPLNTFFYPFVAYEK